MALVNLRAAEEDTIDWDVFMLPSPSNEADVTNTASLNPRAPEEDTIE